MSDGWVSGVGLDVGFEGRNHALRKASLRVLIGPTLTVWMSLKCVHGKWATQCILLKMIAILVRRCVLFAVVNAMFKC